MSMTEVIPQISDPELEQDDPIHSHYIRSDENGTASQKILEASVMGTPVTALCGYTWIPSRNPERHPVCPKCEEIKELTEQFRK